MEPLLLIVTAASLVLGAGMSVVAWKLLRQQRDRSAARAEALRAMVSEYEDDPVPVAPPRRAAAPIVVDEAPLPRFVAASVTPQPPPDRRADALEEPAIQRTDVALASAPDAPWDTMRRQAGAPRVRPASPGHATEVHVRFASTEEPVAPRRRWIAMAGVAVVLTLGIGGAYAAMTLDLQGIVGSGSTASAATANAAEPLQLLSLKHETAADGTFVLTGLVQNPLSGRQLRGVVAVVFLFDQQGRYFAGGKTTIDVPALHPGEESPFVVRVPAAAGVTRYRVGFRLQDGGVVAHVDRRGHVPEGTLEDARDDVSPPPMAPPIAPRGTEN